MIAVAVLMAPLVEECLFRGVVFGTIRPKSRFWAYAASIALFSLYHVWQYVLVYQEPKLLLSALAYVPVSAALTFCYEQTRSIWPPVFFHMCINALSLTVSLFGTGRSPIRLVPSCSTSESSTSMP